MSPSTPGLRAVAVIMIVLGIMFVFPLLTSGVEFLSGVVTRAGRNLIEQLFPLTYVDVDGDGEDDYVVPQHVLVYYVKNLFPSFALNLLVQLVFSLIFWAIEDISFGLAMYHCLVTATTVGYGDVSLTSTSSRLAACFHIVLSVVLLAELLSTIDTLRAERAEQLDKVRQLERRLDAHLFTDLMERVQTLRPKVERDGLGATELEFAMSMLLELEMIEYKQVRPFLKLFRKLNVTGDGRIGENDLKVAGMANAVDGLQVNLGVRGGRRGTIHAAALKQRLQQHNGKSRRASM